MVVTQNHGVGIRMAITQAEAFNLSDIHTVPLY